jgi:hypothetical protein
MSRLGGTMSETLPSGLPGDTWRLFYDTASGYVSIASGGSYASPPAMWAQPLLGVMVFSGGGGCALWGFAIGGGVSSPCSADWSTIGVVGSTLTLGGTSQLIYPTYQ